MSINYNSEPLVSMNDIRKEFPGVKALSGITFDLFRGEIHCLVGENGAGKSTLMKILSGAYHPDQGEIIISGNSYNELTPHLSQELGISVIYQENDLIPTMTVAENVFVGIEKTGRFGFFDFRATVDAVEKEMASLGINIDPLCKIENLSVAGQQFVKILKALVLEPEILIMDEPTSMFNVKDVDKVLNLTKRITGKGISIIYISHFLKEVVQIADRITVIRDGSVINTYDNSGHDTNLDKVTMDMVGRSVDMFYIKEKSTIGEEILRVEELKLQKNSPPVSFYLKKGEILGFAGMVGSGRTEIIRAISGADQFYSGKIYYKGKLLELRSPRDSIKTGIAHITEDRQKLGLMLSKSILENMTLVGLSEKIKGFFVNIKKHPPLIEGIVDSLRIKTPSVFQEAGLLSGGNQQKVVLGKWLFAEADTYIFDEPTRGIDVNAKAEFYKIMCELTKEGKSIIMVSSDMPELISMSDRILVVRKGQVTREMKEEEITEENIIRSALGIEDESYRNV